MAHINMLQVLPFLDDKDLENIAFWLANPDGYNSIGICVEPVKINEIGLFDIDKLLKIARIYIRTHQERCKTTSKTVPTYEKLRGVRKDGLGTATK